MKIILAVFLGGGTGAVLRYLFSILLAAKSAVFPFQTLSANFIGCLIAGFVTALIISKTGINPIYKPLIITGFCGGLTTFSTFSLETVNYIQSGDYIKALLYAFSSFIICILAVILGITFSKIYDNF